MQRPAEFDDEDFKVQECIKLSRANLILLQQKLQEDIDRMADVLANERSHEPQRAEQYFRTIDRRKRQIRWIQTRLATIREGRRRKAVAEQRQSLAKRVDRQAEFHRIFFLLCRTELDHKDFKELCAMANAKMEKPPPIE